MSESLFPDGPRTYQHRFYGVCPRVKWTLHACTSRGEILVAEGIARTKNRAWDESIANVPTRLLRGRS